MKVTLVALTKPTIPGIETAEEFIAYAARVSNPTNQLNNETAPKLLAYLVKHGHWSPFEMAHMVLEVETTRDIARQMLRHRSFAFQEFSQRYARADQLGFHNREARLQDNKNRQNSIAVDDPELEAEWQAVQNQVISISKYAYNWALDRGIAKEQARAALPEGLTGSRLYMAGSIRSWIHFIQTREPGTGTQKEHSDIALEAKRILLQELPSLSSILHKD